MDFGDVMCRAGGGVGVGVRASGPGHAPSCHDPFTSIPPPRDNHLLLIYLFSLVGFPNMALVLVTADPYIPG